MKYLLFFLPLILLLSPAAAPGDVTLPLCSAAIHDSYKAVGPDGSSYPTWHPLVDTAHGCHFDHEHGSNPAFFKAGVVWSQGAVPWPAFGYAATRMGMAEGHAGFKVYVARYAGYVWRIVQHMGTARADIAACVRMHTVDITIANESGTILADLHTMADFGRSVAAAPNLPLLAPPGCPTQGGITDYGGLRQLPVVTHGNNGYEAWRAAWTRNIPGWGLNVTFNAKDPQTACDTLTCTVALPRFDLVYGTPERGAFRDLTFNAGFHIAGTGIYSGTFYTNADLTALRQVSDSDSVRQYIAPGFSLAPAGNITCRPYGIDELYDCTGATYDMQPAKFNPFITGAN